MNKELQDLAWAVLPKEFKEEVKKLYSKFYNEKPHSDCSYGYLGLLIKLFGIHNLVSDAEGEVDEMLYVSRKRVQEMYAHYDKICNDPNRPKDYIESAYEYADGVTMALDDLFGSKCMPDENADDKVDDKVSDDNSSNFDGLEQKTPEPKYHRGEKVRYNGYVYEVEGLVGKNRYALKGLNFDLDEGMIEPYTGPSNEDSTLIQAESVKETRIADEETHLRNLSQETANCDKQFDNILKDSFSKERRLNIAAQFMSAMMSNPSIFHHGLNAEDEDYIVYGSLEFADALIAEAEKGNDK